MHRKSSEPNDKALSGAPFNLFGSLVNDFKHF